MIAYLHLFYSNLCDPINAGFKWNHTTEEYWYNGTKVDHINWQLECNPEEYEDSLINKTNIKKLWIANWIFILFYIVKEIWKFWRSGESMRQKMRYQSNTNNVL